MRRGPAFMPSDYVPSGRTMTVELAGRDRVKFFKRPVVAHIDSQTAQAAFNVTNTRPQIQRSTATTTQTLGLQAPASQSLAAGPGHAAARPRQLEKLPNKVGAEARKPRPRPAAGEEESMMVSDPNRGVKDVAVQTMFRENECQTDPYTPDYYVEEGQNPEVLALMELHYGEGLPAGVAEVEMIDRVQRRKNVEANLPQGSGPEAMHERLQALETLEKTEWEEREAHIKQLQENRLRQMHEALERREQKREERSANRIDAVKHSKLRDVESKLQQLQDKRMTATRKLTQKHVNPCCERPKRDVINAHVLNGAQGKSVKTNSLVEKVSAANYDVRPTLLGFVEGVQELERTQVPKIEKVKSATVQPPNDPAITSLETNFQKRRAHRVVDHLEYANAVVEKSHDAKEKHSSIQDLYRATPRLQRPDTPTLILQGDDEEDREEAMLLLQRLLRGRAVQNDFFEGKERCHGLIEELQAAQNAKENEQWWLEDRDQEVFGGRQEATAQSVVDGVEGDCIFGALDYLFKELKRQCEASNIDKLRVLAESTRQEREQEESAKRHQEERLRAQEEEQHSRVVACTDYTIATYLGQLLKGTVETTAQTQALTEQRQLAAPISHPTTQLEKEDMVCDLLDSFMIPEATRRVEASKNGSVANAVAEVTLAVANQLLPLK